MSIARVYRLGALLLLLIYFSSVACEIIAINCNGTTTSNNSELIGQFINIEPRQGVDPTTLDMECINIRPEISFIIFQVHSYKYNVTLYQGTIEPNTSFVGTNIGMYSRNADKDSSHVFSIANFNDITVDMYISIHGYNNSAPIPGGCNLVWSVRVDPTLDLQYNDSIIKLTAAPGRIGDSDQLDCGSEYSPTKHLYIYHTFYRLYQRERDFSKEEYFDAIRKMITKENIENYGEQVPQSDKVQKLFSVYPGTGTVYSVVVTTPYGVAVYVPTHTYGCSLAEGNDSCVIFSDVFSQVTCALMFFAGLFLCYFGHHFFKTEMFLVGLLSGAIITYMVIPLATRLDPTTMLGAALLSGVFFGAIWWLLWWFVGIPVLSVQLATTLFGFLCASILMFVIPDGNESLTLDANYWSIFFIVMFFVPAFLTYVTMHANILCCAVLGAYGTIYPIDHYIGSNLKYIVINIVRRAVVPGFQKAYLAPPFQWRDALLILLWIMLSITGILFQVYRNRGRAPFPPPPRNAMPTVTLRRNYSRLSGQNDRPRSRVINERSPLLSS